MDFKTIFLSDGENEEKIKSHKKSNKYDRMAIYKVPTGLKLYLVAQNRRSYKNERGLISKR